MAQGQLGLYGQCPAEIQPAAQRVRLESMTLGRTRRGSRSIYADDSGSEEELAAGGPGLGAADPERARSAQSSGWWRYMATCNGHRGSPQAESCTDCGAAGARTRMARVCTPLDRDNLLGCVTESRDCSGWSEEWDAGRVRLPSLLL